MVNKMGSMGEYFFRVYLYLIIIELLEQVSIFVLHTGMF